MKAKKSSNQRYNTLLARDVLQVQTAHLKKSFELAESSMVAEKVASFTNEAIRHWEEGQEMRRLNPGELLLEHDGERFVLPLLDQRVIQKIKNDVSVKAVKRELEMLQYERLREVNPDASLEDLWELTNQTDLTLRRGKKETPVPEKPLAAHEIKPLIRTMEHEEIPLEVLKPTIDLLVEQWGLRPGQAEGMAMLAGKLYTWCCPREKELQPGQLVWLAHGTKKSRRADPRLFSPVVLTLLTAKEQEISLASRTDLKKLKLSQIERITAEAWRQDGVLTTVDLEWILGIPPTLIRELLEDYQEHFGIILPTAGTVLDMGRTLTHKALVVEMALDGMTTHEIARRIYHTPEAVDNYLRLFDRVLLLCYYQVPIPAMPRITGHSKGLLEEHLALVEKHFPNQESMEAYLGNRGVKLEQSS
ncbi:MAG: DUF1670 domain-containing protein [Firmicutes bacterium]|nr:DUF1670 domain-containing protein [Bacillota bacterium]